MLFYADFTEWRGYSPTNILGSLLKQIIGELEKLPGEISRTFQEHKEMLGGRGLRKAGIKLLLEDLQRRADQYYHHTPTKIPLIGFTELHYASVFGIAEIETSLMDQTNYKLDKIHFLGIAIPNSAQLEKYY